LHKKYLENAVEKLEAAEYLFEGKFYSDAVSRAYYSMFYSAKLLLSMKELYPRSHKGVISSFGLNSLKKDLSKIYMEGHLAMPKIGEKSLIMTLKRISLQRKQKRLLMMRECF
jgi:uncharacterized protein (UPF0332 family)